MMNVFHLLDIDPQIIYTGYCSARGNYLQFSFRGRSHIIMTVIKTTRGNSESVLLAQYLQLNKFVDKKKIKIFRKKNQQWRLQVGFVFFLFFRLSNFHFKL